MHVAHNVSFKSLSTFKVGGVAKQVVYPETKEALRDVIRQVRASEKALLILGGGSNIVPPDEDFDGVVIIPALKNISINTGVVTAGAGVLWDELVQTTVEHDLWGFENLSSIPGTVGGAVVQNIGAYGAALSQTVKEVHAYDIDNDSYVTFKNDACQFGYRTSIFKEERGRYVILEVVFSLSQEPEPDISYKDLQEYFKHKETPSLKEIRDAVIAIRKEKFPDLSLFGTAGSFFLNPVVREEEARVFRAKYLAMPLFHMPEGGTKVPLAWLLDNVCDVRGMREGGAMVWPAQVLVIATEDGATAQDIQTLAEKIKQKVQNKINVEINFEVTFL